MLQCVAQQREQREQREHCLSTACGHCTFAEAIRKASPLQAVPEVLLHNPMSGSAQVNVHLAQERNSLQPTSSGMDAADEPDSISYLDPELKNLFLISAYLNNR